jgi:hypothetical protein
MNNEPTPRYLSVKATARRYGTSVSTLYVHIGRGKIQAIKFGGRTLICIRSADAYFDGLPLVKLGRK